MTEDGDIVAGGGTAGCVIAARLPQCPGARVLLLESRGAPRTAATRGPNAWLGNLGAAVSGHSAVLGEMLWRG